MKYVVIDTETTGLDHRQHEMLSLGAIVMIDNIITETIEIKIKPRNIQNAEIKALQINGYSEYRWKNALNADQAIRMIHAFMLRHQDGILVGHNVQFDINFIKSLGNEFKIDIPISTPYIDTRDVCRVNLAPYGCSSMSLDNICEFLGWERRKAHTALSDCEDCIKIIRCMCPPDPKFLARLKFRRFMKDFRGLIK